MTPWYLHATLPPTNMAPVRYLENQVPLAGTPIQVPVSGKEGTWLCMELFYDLICDLFPVQNLEAGPLLSLVTRHSAMPMAHQNTERETAF